MASLLVSNRIISPNFIHNIIHTSDWQAEPDSMFPPANDDSATSGDAQASPNLQSVWFKSLRIRKSNAPARRHELLQTVMTTPSRRALLEYHR